MLIFRFLLVALTAAEFSMATPSFRRHPKRKLTSSPNVLNLKRTSSQSGSSKHFNHLQRKHFQEESRRRDIPEGKPTHLTDIHGLDFVAKVEFGGGEYDVLIDTGSSEFWLATDDFTCRNSNGTTVDRSECAMGPGYDGTFSGGDISNSNFLVTYGTDWNCLGKAGLGDVGIAGITVTNQTMGLVDSMYYLADNKSSGLLGMAGQGTGVYTGTYPPNDGKDTQIPHDTLFTNMWKQGLSSPIFSMAQQRDTGDGWLAFGGLPPVTVAGGFATAPLAKSDLVSDGSGKSWYGYYDVVVDSMVYASAGGSSNITTASSTTVPLNSTMLLDSGTQLVYLQEDVGTPVLQSYDPPAQFVPNLGNFGVACNATPPALGFQLGGKIFQIDAADMIKQDKVDPETGLCGTGVGIISLDFSILGDTFLNNVVAAFDVEHGEVSFAQHKY